MLKRRIFRKHDGEKALRARYLDVYKKPYDPERVQTFGDKLFRRMIETNRTGNPIFTRLSDKYSVRDFVSETIGSAHLTPLLWSGADPSEIPFDTLPAKCIAKTNHGSGGHCILERPVDRDSVVRKLRDELKKNYYWTAREYQYYPIKPRVMVEALLDDGLESGPLDYKFWCFNGKPEVVQVDNTARTINPFYNAEWKKISLHYRDTADTEATKPPNFEDMLSVASRLASGLDFVRVDLYNIHGKTVFGEMTFTPMAGYLKLQPDHWDSLFGAKWISSPQEARWC
jgi:TupA-like ATPgrasp